MEKKLLLKEQIFEAVEALRVRKCRPDRETIAHYVTRKFGIQFQDVFTELENIVDQGGLLKVEYKGSTSYRSPEQLESNSSPLLTKHSKILNSSRTSRLVITGVSELLNENPDWNTDGIPQKDLEVKLVSFDCERFNSNTMQTILDREISVGNLLVSRKTGRMFPKDLFPKDDDEFILSLPIKPRGGKGRRNKSSSSSSSLASLSSSQTSKPQIKIEAGTNNSNNQDEDGRKEVVERVAAAVRKTYGFAKATPAQAQAQQAPAAPNPSPPPPPAAPIPDSPASPDPEPTSTIDTVTLSSLVKNTTASGGRHSARNKRKKEVFDPSDLPPPPPVKKGSINTCKSCNKQIVKGEDVTTTCCVCASQYHNSCIPELAKLKPTISTSPTTRRGAAASASSNTSAPITNWTCPSCKECDVCGGGGNAGIGEEELLDYVCTKCDNVVILHQKCIEATDERKCGKCSFGIIEPTTGTSTTNSTEGVKRKKGRPPKKSTINARKAAAAASSSKNSHQNNNKSKSGDDQSSATEEDEDDKSKVKKSSSAPPESDGDESMLTKHEHDTNDQDESLSTALGYLSSSSSNNNTETSIVVEAHIIDDPQYPNLKSHGEEEIELTDKDNNMDATVEIVNTNNIPNPKEASTWTPKDVQAFFHSKGLTEEGNVFREQEIDGVALLLMTRADIVHGMNFLLGPALKIYRLIVELQKA